MGKMPSLVAPRITGDLKRPEIVISPRMDLAANLGVTTAGIVLCDPHRDLGRHRPEQREILAVRSPDPDPRRARRECTPAKLSTIQNLPVQTQTGGSVPLGLVAEIGFGAGPTKIERVALQRQIVIGADRATIRRTASRSSRARR
jgi:multidrug efflux pump subunit AcrB